VPVLACAGAQGRLQGRVDAADERVLVKTRKVMLDRHHDEASGQLAQTGQHDGAFVSRERFLPGRARHAERELRGRPELVDDVRQLDRLEGPQTSQPQPSQGMTRDGRRTGFGQRRPLRPLTGPFTGGHGGACRAEGPEAGSLLETGKRESGGAGRHALSSPG
jgi:hypothetical protein